MEAREYDREAVLLEAQLTPLLQEGLAKRVKAIREDIAKQQVYMKDHIEHLPANSEYLQMITGSYDFENVPPIGVKVLRLAAAKAEYPEVADGSFVVKATMDVGGESQPIVSVLAHSLAGRLNQTDYTKLSYLTAAALLRRYMELTRKPNKELVTT